MVRVGGTRNEKVKVQIPFPEKNQKTSNHVFRELNASIRQFKLNI